MIKNYSLYCIFVALTVVWSPTMAQSGTGSGKFEIFGDKIPDGAQWKGKDYSRLGGYNESSHYIYVGAQEQAEITGLSVRIREKPGAGEYRYITFAWVKWGGEQIAMKFHHDPAARHTAQLANRYQFTYFAGEVTELTGFRIGNTAPARWTVTTRDLWKDFGDFTLTGVSFICPVRRDAGFDAIFLGKTTADFDHAPDIIPLQVANPVEVKGDESDTDSLLYKDEAIIASENDTHTDSVQIDWAAQIRAGGIWMYPLYLLGFIALIVTMQRMMTARGARLAPQKLRKTVRDSLISGNIDAAIESCNTYPSTLAESLRFIFSHRNAGIEAVSQTAGDMAARDIRTHLAKIYPLSVIASVAPLLGLLGTIVGMIEAFGLVALYGDEGGAAILSDSISKALITTAAGLIIAAPSVYVYFIIKNRIMRFATLIEMEIEAALTALYLSDDKDKFNTENKISNETITE